VVDRPDIVGREEILKIHARIVKLSPDVDLKVIASRTPGFVGADLANIVNEAALLAARKNKESVEMADIEEAIDRVIAGLEKKGRLMSKKKRNRCLPRIRPCDCGHPLTERRSSPSYLHRSERDLCFGLYPSIAYGGSVFNDENRTPRPFGSSAGGRVAEEVVFGEISTGAHNDLQRATDIAPAWSKRLG